jgi:hypothetical protein
MSESNGYLFRASKKLAACITSGVMAEITSDESKALLKAIEVKEEVVAPKTPVVIGQPGVFVSKGSASVFMSYDRDHDSCMNAIAHQAKKLLMEILDGKVD